ncbi:PREDICTED: transmembrane protein 245 isoform X2 [Dinoponera quadriceps]|uniref:Transmembrane protein 245 isoform X2 n=1 Tax=Dinoponera quadriceps TaxID=609295 RepID=A0A6P3X3R7_DINQU|nr:PREDICTED: transmembrane protein 245 isoform X2 [Dinoponera quadriceps]
MDNARSPMDNLLNMLSGFSAGHEKGLKQGTYNAVALFLLFLILAAGYGLYIILSPFLKPLIWALLCGSVLFPFKYSLATTVQSWFTKVETSHTPLVVNISLLPVHIFNNVSERLGSFLWTNVKYIVGVLLLLLVILGVYHYVPTVMTYLDCRLFRMLAAVSEFFITTCNIYTVSTILIGYLMILYIHWTPENSVRFCYTSFVIWLIISMYLSSAAGTYRVYVFTVLQILYVAGFVYEVLSIMESQVLDRHLTFSEAARLALINNLPASAQEEDKVAPLRCEKRLVPEEENASTGEETKGELETIDTARKVTPTKTKLGLKSMSLDGPASSTGKLARKLWPNVYFASPRDRYLLSRLKAEFRVSMDIQDDKVDTDKYMYAALYACIGMLLWKHLWIMHILVIPVACYIVKQLGGYFGFWETIHRHCDAMAQAAKSWCLERHQALLPSNIRGLYKMLVIVDEKVRDALKGSVDSVATIAVILGLIVFTTCASIFITVQVYAEGLHLVEVTGEILNSFMNNSDIDWVPEKWEESVNSVLDNAYTYGRGAISDGIRRLMNDLEPTKAEQMEKKVLELWDRLYQAWMMSSEDSNLVGPTVDITSAYNAWESLKEGFEKTPLQMFNMTSMQNFVKENIGILMSVLDSVWSIVRGNMSIILTIFTELFYVVLMSGSAVLNFALSTVVFFTTLFYLLSSSGKTYKPIELTTTYSPISCHRFAMALQEAVIEVFAATFKLASFFGMWTWFIHNLFQVKIVYLPSAFATMLGAVPFLDAYIACIPATVELWFTRGSVIAILFFLFHFLPCNIVVTEFYKEIKGGGHPYLTGLSIAGGIFCLGVEGAIFGPLLLCCIMVAINMSRRYLHSPSSAMENRTVYLETP